MSNWIGIPKAIDAMIEILWAASIPSISKVGSASAYPNSCAWFSTVSKLSPLLRISDKIKFPVPLIIPAIHSIRFAVRPSRKALIIGIPPATAASNATITPCFSAAANISVPCEASIALLAVTTCLPFSIALSVSSFAVV